METSARNDGKQGEHDHVILAENPFEQHDKPKIQGRFVRVDFSLVVEREEVPVSQSLVRDTQVF